MENATKAMIIAAGVLIGIMILSLGVVLYEELSSYVESSHEEIRFNELNKFNTQFTQYINNSGELTIQDVVTAANLAHQNNVKYNVTEEQRGDESSFYVAIYLNKNISLENLTSEQIAQLLKNNIKEGNQIKNFKCASKDVQISTITGRVYEIHFYEE